MKIIYNIVVLGSLLVSSQLMSQGISLENIHQQVLAHNYEIRLATNDRVIGQERYGFFRSLLKPQISLSADLPNYVKTSFPVVQPDGTLSFQSIRQANSAVSAQISQVLPSTGTQFILSSRLQQFNDFSSDVKQYNGIPIRFGIRHTVFGFNPWKYDQKIEPLLQEEADRQFDVEVEQALRSTTDLFFNVLIAQQDVEIARTNQLVNQNLMKITDERFTLGKISLDEKLQLEIELNKSTLALTQAQFELNQAKAILQTTVGNKLSVDADVFTIPLYKDSIDVPIGLLLESYDEHRPETISYQRQLHEANRSIAQAKADFGFQMDLEASIGLARGANTIGDVYQDPFDEQQFNVSLRVPLVDWGRRKSIVKQEKLRKENTEIFFERQFAFFKNDIEQRALLFSQMQQELLLLEEIMNKANDRYTISNERYVLGDIDIINLTISQQEKDQTKRNYINALRRYWLAYYDLRTLTGYDIINKSKIQYTSL